MNTQHHYRIHNDDPDSEGGSYTRMGTSVQDPIGPTNVPSMRDESMSSAYVDSFFLPGGIFEPDEDKVEASSMRRSGIDSSQELIANNNPEGYLTSSHSSRSAYEGNLSVKSTHHRSKDSSIDRQFAAYPMANDGASRISSYQAHSSAPSDHRQLLFEPRHAAVHPRLDFFQQNMDVIGTDPRSGTSASTTTAVYPSHNTGELRNNATIHPFVSNRNQEDLQSSSSFLSSTSPLNTSSGPSQRAIPFDENNNFRSTLQFPHQNNWRDVVGSSILSHSQDNFNNYRNVQNNSVLLPSNPWRNANMTQSGCIPGSSQAGVVQNFQYLGHSPSEHSEYFTENNTHLILNTTTRSNPRPLIFQDPHNLGHNTTYGNQPTESNDCGTPLLSNNTSWQPPSHVPINDYVHECSIQMLSATAIRSPPMVLPDTRTHTQNVMYNPSASFTGHPTMIAANTVTTPTATANATVGHSARVPPGFPSSQHHPSFSPYEQHNDDPTSIMRKISSFHAMDHQENNDNIVYNTENKESSFFQVQHKPQVQQNQRKEVETRHIRDRDVDSQSSRGGVPSTIYLRTDDDEDGISFSEDTITACADSVAEYDREYLRRAHMTRTHDNQHVTQVGQSTEDKRFKLVQDAKGSLEKDSFDRDRSMNDDVPNTEDEEDDEDDDLNNYVDGKLDENIRKTGTVDEPVKKPKRRKKKIKKVLCNESVSSRDVSNEVVPIKEPIMQQSSGHETARLVKTENSTSFPSLAVETNNIRSERVRHTKGMKVKFPQSPNYHLRQQKVNGILDENASSVPKTSLFQKSLLEIIENCLRTVLNALNVAVKMLYASSTAVITDIARAATVLLPSWERLWFVLPVFCFICDICFIIFCILSSFVGKLSYCVLLAHKLALMEISENATAVICYTLTSSFPIVAAYILAIFPSLPAGSMLVLWYTIIRLILSPMGIEETFLSRVNDARQSLRAKKTIMSKGPMLSIGPSMYERTKGSMHSQLSERLHLTNQFLSTLRYMIPLFLLVECLSTGYGFILAMSLQERILLGFGLTVIRMGYIFVPIIFTSWTLQLLLILLFPIRFLQIYLLLLFGLSSIRLSHFATAQEDMKMKALKR